MWWGRWWGLTVLRAACELPAASRPCPTTSGPDGCRRRSASDARYRARRPAVHALAQVDLTGAPIARLRAAVHFRAAAAVVSHIRRPPCHPPDAQGLPRSPTLPQSFTDFLPSVCRAVSAGEPRRAMHQQLKWRLKAAFLDTF